MARAPAFIINPRVLRRARNLLAASSDRMPPRPAVERAIGRVLEAFASGTRSDGPGPVPFVPDRRDALLAGMTHLVAFSHARSIDICVTGPPKVGSLVISAQPTATRPRVSGIARSFASVEHGLDPYMWSYDYTRGVEVYLWSFGRVGLSYELHVFRASDLDPWTARCCQVVPAGNTVIAPGPVSPILGERVSNDSMVRDPGDPMQLLAVRTSLIKVHAVHGVSSPSEGFDALLPSLPGTEAFAVQGLKPDSRLRA